MATMLSHDAQPRCSAIAILVTKFRYFRNSQVVNGDCGDLAKFGKNATKIMIFLPHYMWAENNMCLGPNSVQLKMSKSETTGV